MRKTKSRWNDLNTPLALNRKKALMPISTLKQHKLRRPAHTVPDHGGPRATDLQDYAWLVRRSADSRPYQQLDPEEPATSSVEPDESLVADPRASLKPCQIVDQRLLALVGSGSPGLYIQASGRPQGVRRQAGE